MSVELNDSPEDLTTQTVIQNRYSFWCHKRGKQTATNYEEAMKQVGNFQTIEHFWRIYNHMLRPSEFKTTTDFHLFKYGIKPTWEDPQNERGGKWMVRLKKGLTAHYWEELIIAIIGEQFDVGHEICGAVVSVRNNEHIISVWNKNAENTEAKNKIRDQMRRILKLPAFINVEYKKHQDSLVDKSSFRNTVVWRSENAQDRDRGPRKPRTYWSDRGEHSGNDRSHGHRHERSKDSSAGHDNSHSPRGFQYNSRGDKDKDKDASTNSSSSSSRTWQSSGNSTSSSTWKSPRNTSSSSTSPRNQSAWGTASSTGSHSARSSKPSPTTTPSASASAGGGWFRGDASKTDGRGDKSADSAYVPLGGSRQQGGSSQPSGSHDGSSGEQRKRGGSGGAGATENVWGRVKSA